MKIVRVNDRRILPDIDWDIFQVVMPFFFIFTALHIQTNVNYILFFFNIIHLSRSIKITDNFPDYRRALQGRVSSFQKCC